MVEVEKYIKRLLYDQNCVIIPDFGAVLTHYLPARFDETSGQYLPSERKVAFNEVLKVDDGLLAKFISQNEGISYEQAQQHIRDFVQTMQGLVRKNKTIVLNGVGSFELNNEGRVVFQPDSGRNFHSDFYGLMAVPATDLRRVPAEPLWARDLTTTVGERGQERERSVASPRKISWGNWLSAASIACILVYVSAVFSQEPGATSSMSPIETIRSLFTSKNSPEVKTSESLEVLSNPAVDNREVLNDSHTGNTVEESVTVNPKEITKRIERGADHRFYVIASVYDSQSSLDKYGAQMADRLRSAGIESVDVLSVRDKYMLTAGSYETWQEARKAVPVLNKTVKGAWIYKRK